MPYIPRKKQDYFFSFSQKRVKDYNSLSFKNQTIVVVRHIYHHQDHAPALDDESYEVFLKVESKLLPLVGAFYEESPCSMVGNDHNYIDIATFLSGLGLNFSDFTLIQFTLTVSSGNDANNDYFHAATISSEFQDYLDSYGLSIFYWVSNPLWNYIGTAADNNKAYQYSEYNLHAAPACNINDFSVFAPIAASITKHLKKQVMSMMELNIADSVYNVNASSFIEPVQMEETPPIVSDENTEVKHYDDQRTSSMNFEGFSKNIGFKLANAPGGFEIYIPVNSNVDTFMDGILNRNDPQLRISVVILRGFAANPHVNTVLNLFGGSSSMPVLVKPIFIIYPLKGKTQYQRVDSNGSEVTAARRILERERSNILARFAVLNYYLWDYSVKEDGNSNGMPEVYWQYLHAGRGYGY